MQYLYPSAPPHPPSNAAPAVQLPQPRRFVIACDRDLFCLRLFCCDRVQMRRARRCLFRSSAGSKHDSARKTERRSQKRRWRSTPEWCWTRALRTPSSNSRRTLMSKSRSDGSVPGFVFPEGRPRCLRCVQGVVLVLCWCPAGVVAML